MKEIKYHDRNYLRKDSLVMLVDENDVHFKNGIASVNATVKEKENDSWTIEIYSGIINQDFEEVFDDKRQYGDCPRNLMFLPYNTNIFRCTDNDFIVTVCRGDEFHHHYANKHIRLQNMKTTIINEDIGTYEKTNNKNILIVGSEFKCDDKKLYNISEGKYIGNGYDEISIIENNPDCFFVKKRINSLTEETRDDREQVLTDNLYFQIDKDGHITSKIFSERKLDFLDYGTTDIDNYPSYYKQELIEESKTLKRVVYSLKHNQK